MKYIRIPVRSTPSGHEISIPVYFFKGKRESAKKAYFQSSIHGAEQQGNAVIFHLIEFLKKNPPLGDVTLIPLCNPFGIDRKLGEYTEGRFDPATGDNWNRFYLNPNLDHLKPKLTIPALKLEMQKAIRARLKTNIRFAEKLALILQNLAVSADVVLDLHNANVSLPYVYASDGAVDDARHLGIPHIISIPQVFGGSLDEAISVPWSKLQKSHNLPVMDLPKGYTIELGSQERMSLSDGKKEAEQMLEFLKHKGVLTGKPKKPGPALVCDLADYQTLYAPIGGIYHYPIETGSVVQKGTVLAECLRFGPNGGVVTQIKAETKCLVTLHYSSSGVNEGDELLKIFSKWREIS